MTRRCPRGFTVLFGLMLPKLESELFEAALGKLDISLASLIRMDRLVLFGTESLPMRKVSVGLRHELGKPTHDRVTFSIVLVTFDRPRLVEFAIQSVLNQSYGGWILHVIDNGSNPAVVPRSEWLADPRIRWRRLDENLHGCDVGESALRDCDGTHLLVLGDDDALVPDALSHTASAIEAVGAEIVGGASVGFDHESGVCDTVPRQLASWDGRLESFDAMESALMFCNGWGIGPKRRYAGPPAAHPSSTFVSIPLIHRTLHRQGRLFVKPFGDIGLVGCCANAERVFFMHVPIAMIGRSNNQESHASRRGHRHRLAREREYLTHTGLHGLSWVNAGCEGHLHVAIANELGSRMPLSLRPEFYKRHIRQVLSDSPWTAQTLRDVIEALPGATVSLVRCFSPTFLQARLRRWRERLDGTKARARREQTSYRREVRSLRFGDILQAASHIASESVRLANQAAARSTAPAE